MKKLLLLPLITMLICCEMSKPVVYPLELNFEKKSDLDKISWECRALFAITDSFAVEGNSSLRVEYFPQKYANLKLHHFKKDWSESTVLALSVYNPQSDSYKMWIKINDRGNRPSFKDRYNGAFELKPGFNNIKIPFAEMRTSGDGRLLDSGRIYSVVIFFMDVTKPFTVYFDNIRIE